MTQLATTFAISVLACSAVACSTSADSAPKSNGAPAAKTTPVACDAAAITALGQSLDKANGLNVDLSDNKVQAEIEAAKANIIGKRFAFTGCTFARQGNDEVTFSATGTDVELNCAMQDGEAGVRAFRDKAMELGSVDKLRLDVRGEVALGGTKGFERLQMRKCTIDVHE